MLHWRRKADYAPGCDHASRKLRYQGITEETPALTSRKGTRWRTSIESKQRDKYETNEINKNIGRGSGLCGSVWGGVGTGDDNHDDNSGPCDWHDHNSVDDHDERRDNYGLHAGFGVYHVSHVSGCCPGSVLLYKRDDHSGSSRAYRNVVSRSPGHAGYRVLHECG